MTAKAKVPKLSSEAQERKFWEAHDSANLVDWSKATRVRLPNLKPSLEEKLSQAVAKRNQGRGKCA